MSDFERFLLNTVTQSNEKINISILKYLKVNLALYFNIVMLLYLHSLPSDAPAPYVLYGPVAHNTASHWLACIYMWRNPSAEYLRAITHCTHTLLIYFSLSQGFVALASCCTKENRTRTLVSIHACDQQETDGSSIKGPICFGTWKWKRWTDVKTM